MKKWQLLGILLLAASCMPDSLTKFKEEPVKKEKAAASTTKTTTLPDGSIVTIPASGGTSETAPTSFTYASTEVVAYLNESMTANLGTPSPSGSYTAGFYFSTSSSGCQTPGSAAIATSFPSDLTINAATGTISGTPTTFSGRKAYYIKMLHIPTGNVLCRTVFITKISKIADFQFLHGIGDNLIIKLSTLGSITDLTVNPFYSTNYDADPRYVVTDYGARAKINYVDWTLKKLFVTVTAADDTYDLTTPEFNQFDTNDKVDVGDSTDLGVATPLYFVNRALISDITQVFSTLKDFKTNALARRIPVTDPYVAPSFASTDEWTSLSFSIGPNIDTDLTIDFNKQSVTMTSTYGGELKSTAVVSAVAPLNPKVETDYIVTLKDTTGKNIAGSYKFSVVTPPQNFGLTRWQLLKIDDATKFNLGDKISSSGDASVGTVRQVVSRATSNHFILIEVEKGVFAVTNSIDNVKPYYGEKTIVRASYPVNAVVKTDHNIFWTAATVSGVPTTTRYFSTFPDNDEGIVQYVVNAGPGDNFMYLMITSGSLSVGDTIYDVDASSSSVNSAKILEIDSPEAILTVASATNYEVGMEVTTINGAIGVVNKISGSNLYVTNQLHMQACSVAINSSVLACDTAAGTWSLNSYAPDADRDGVIDAATDDIDNLHYYAGTDTIITVVETYNAFNLYRGENITIQPHLYKGDSVTYELVGTLPTGLSFDSATGKISGTPIDFSANASYTVRAFNAATVFSNVPSMTFDLKVFEYFEIQNTTTNATSFILHKEGQGRLRSRCLITQEQIDAASLGSKDINCNLEAGELDLYNSGLSLKANVGKGLCEHFTLAPYYFFNWSYKKSIVSGAPNPWEVSKNFVFRSGDFDKPACASNGVGVNPAYAITTAQQSTPASYLYLDINTVTNYSAGNYDINKCVGDYSKTKSTYPNCDDGDTSLDTFNYQDTSACGGAAAACAGLGAVPCVAQAGCSWDGVATCSGTATACSAITAATTCGAQSGCAWAYACTTTVTSSATTACAGKVSACTNGAAKDTTLDVPNFRKELIAADNGLAKTWNFTAPIQKTLFTNIYLANYTKSNTCAATGNNYSYKSNNWEGHASYSYTENMTLAVPAPGDPFVNSNAFYTFTCLDAGYDIVARVRLTVRDWDRDFKATHGIDRSDPATLCSGYVALGTCNAVPGCFWNTTTSLCLSAMDNNATDAFGVNYNNRADWDDTGFKATVTAGTCNIDGGLFNELGLPGPTSNTSNFTTPYTFPRPGL